VRILDGLWAGCGQQRSGWGVERMDATRWIRRQTTGRCREPVEGPWTTSNEAEDTLDYSGTTGGATEGTIEQSEGRGARTCSISGSLDARSILLFGPSRTTAKTRFTRCRSPSIVGWGAVLGFAAIWILEATPIARRDVYSVSFPFSVLFHYLDG
jgi:hypothetical protein